MVTVRLFAALREAAGTSATTVGPGPLPDLLAELEARYGETFAARLRVASVLIDGSAVERGADSVVPDGAEVALLPPFSGGALALPFGAAAPSPPGGSMRPTVPVTVVLTAALLGALLVGRPALVAVVLVLSVLLLVDLQAVLLRAGTPAILPAAAVAGLGAPLVAAFRWETSFAALVAASFLVAIVAALAAQRRHIARALGVTLLAGLATGLGGGAVILLGDAEPALLLTLIGGLGAGELAVAGVRRSGRGARESEALAALAAATAAAGLATLALPLQVAAGTGALALLGVLGGGALRAALIPRQRPPRGLVVAATASLALSAPAALAVAGNLLPGG